MNKFNLSILVAAITLTACNPNDAFTQKLETEIDSVSYSLGAFNALQLQGQGLEDINADAVRMGIKHIFNNDSLISEILIIVLSVLSSIRVPPLKSTPKFNPLNMRIIIDKIIKIDDKIFSFL